MTNVSAGKKGVEEWLSTREERNKQEAEENRVKTPAEIALEKERAMHASLVFPSFSKHSKLNLRDFVQEMFNGVDPENSGRIQIDTLSRAIQHNQRLVEMLESRPEVSVLSLLHSSGTELSSLDRLDLDRDGWLTVTELLVFARSHESEMREEEKARVDEEKEESRRAEEERRRVEEEREKRERKEKEERRRMREKEEEEARRKPAPRSVGDIGEEGGRSVSDSRRPSRRPRRPKSANLRRRRDRWLRLASQKRPTTAGPYSQTAIASDRRRSFFRMKELFEESYQKSLRARKRIILMMNQKT